MQRVAVFIDYQNVYKRAREAFSLAESEHHAGGQIRPVAVGLTLCASQDRNLVAVHIYRGLPSAKQDPKGYEAAQRQLAAWQSTGGGLVHLHTRPLNYRDPQRPREKGIDVQLAIDFVMLATRRDYDVGIIFSDDTDLHPALEAVGEILGPGHCELAGWHDWNRHAGPRIVRSGGQNVYNHLLRSVDYQRVKDTQDYTQKSARKPRPPKG